MSRSTAKTNLYSIASRTGFRSLPKSHTCGLWLLYVKKVLFCFLFAETSLLFTETCSSNIFFWRFHIRQGCCEKTLNLNFIFVNFLSVVSAAVEPQPKLRKSNLGWNNFYGKVDQDRRVTKFSEKFNKRLMCRRFWASCWINESILCKNIENKQT